jgi:HYDIN/CFA65/VesB family protein
MPYPRVWHSRQRLGALVAALAMAPLPLITATPAAATASPPNLTIVSTSTWTGHLESDQVLHIVGQVRNDDSTQTAQDILVDCRLFDSANAQVAEETTPVDAAFLLPTEASPFDDLFLLPPVYDHYSCTTQSAPTNLEPDHNFSATITSVTPGPSTGEQLVSGTVTNNNTVSVSDAQLYFTFYANATDNPPKTIAEDRLAVNDGNPLAPGSVTPFTLSRFKPPWSGDAYALLVEAPTPAVSLDKTSITLTQVKTTTSAAQLVSLTNVGTGDLHIGALTLGGAHPTEWAVSGTCAGATIVPLGSCSISVTFTPADTGDRGAVLSIADDANHTPQTITLNGTGTNPQAVPSPSPLAFGSQVVNTTSAAQTLTLSNPGIGDLHVTTITLSGANAPDFAITSDACSNSTVAQGANCALELTFHPAALGGRNTTLTINDDALNSPQTLSVSGTGVSANVQFDKAVYNFGNENVDSTSAPMNVRITNVGTSRLTVTSVCPDSTEFSAGTSGSGNCAAGFNLDPDEFQDVPVTFSPARIGVRTATLTVNDSAPDSPQHVTLVGRGTYGGQYHSLAPVRIYDTRNGAGPLGAGLQGAPPRAVLVAGGTGPVPSNATAVVLNVTVTNTTASSFLTIYPTGVARPTASNLNWVKGQTVPNLVEVGVGAGGFVSVYNAAGTTDVIFDVAGYVSPEVDTPGPDGFFNPMSPARVLDTRNATGAPKARIAAGQKVDVQLTGTPGIPPSGVAAVVLNVTVTNATAASFLTVYPTGVTRPTASNLNFVAGQTVPNRVVVKVGTGGKVSFYNAAGNVDVIADVGGWFTDTAAGGTGAGFNPLPPTRILDTRNGTGGAQARVGQSPITLTVAGAAGIHTMSDPIPPTAVVLNVTVTNPTAGSFLSLWPNGTTRPTASDLNFTAGQTVPNLVVVKVGTDGKIGIFNAAGLTDVVVDVVGWYS